MNKAGGNESDSTARTISELELELDTRKVDVEVVDTKFEGEVSGPIPSTVPASVSSTASITSEEIEEKYRTCSRNEDLSRHENKRIEEGTRNLWNLNEFLSREI